VSEKPGCVHVVPSESLDATRARAGALAEMSVSVEEVIAESEGNVRLLLAEGKLAHDRRAVRFHEQQRFARGPQAEIRVQILTGNPPILPGSEHHKITVRIDAHFGPVSASRRETATLSGPQDHP